MSHVADNTAIIRTLLSIVEDIQGRINSLSGLIDEVSEHDLMYAAASVDRYKHKIQGLHIAGDTVLYQLRLHVAILQDHCPRCHGTGKVSELDGSIEDCPMCSIKVKNIEIPRNAR